MAPPPPHVRVIECGSTKEGSTKEGSMKEGSTKEGPTKEGHLFATPRERATVERRKGRRRTGRTRTAECCMGGEREREPLLTSARTTTSRARAKKSAQRVATQPQPANRATRRGPRGGERSDDIVVVGCGEGKRRSTPEGGAHCHRAVIITTTTTDPRASGAAAEEERRPVVLPSGGRVREGEARQVRTVRHTAVHSEGGRTNEPRARRSRATRRRRGAGRSTARARPVVGAARWTNPGAPQR